ncbi:MAG: type II secretion system F family protein [Lentisphaeria bacterium]|nr:type II secretion system F family protein [Lentisphaeria bacterium]
MAIYRFKVADATAKISEILVEGDSQSDALRRIARRGMTPVECLGEGGVSAGQTESRLFRSELDIVDFTDRLVPLLEAHVPLEKALDIVAKGCREGNPRETVEDIRRGLHEGRRFSRMVRDRSTIFPPLYASLVEAAEEAGALPEVLADLRDFLNERREMRSFIVSSSIYPVVILVVSLTVVGVLLGVIVPRFSDILLTAGGELSAPTGILLAVSAWFRKLWWMLIVVPIFCGWLYYAFKSKPAVQLFRDRWLLRLPVVGKAALAADIARMFRTMSILMRRGVGILNTVRLGGHVLQNQVLRQSLTHVAGELRKGGNLTDALSHSRFIPSVTVQTLAIGEETGELATMLEKVGERYEKDLKKMIARALALLEPAIILFLGLLVAMIVVTMFLAIMDMQSGI